MISNNCGNRRVNWEHLTLAHEGRLDSWDDINKLDRVGRQGWELVSVVYSAPWWTLFFKRPLREEVDHEGGKET